MNLNEIHEEATRRLRAALASGKLKVRPIVLVVNPGSGDVPIGYCKRPEGTPARL